MHIEIEHHKDQFNVAIASAKGREAFLVIKGCRVKDGSKGRWVSGPATKNGDKWWNHTYMSEPFQAAVIAAYDASTPSQQRRQQDEGPPF